MIFEERLKFEQGCTLLDSWSGPDDSGIQQ